MVTRLPRPETYLRTAARSAGVRLSRLAAVVVAVIAGLLASAAVVPAAFANPIPIGDGGTVPATPVPATTVRVFTTGGLAGWQITLIALGAALLAAAATLVLDRAWAAHRAAAATRA
jgi:hypothetical protein